MQQLLAPTELSSKQTQQIQINNIMTIIAQ